MVHRVRSANEGYNFDVPAGCVALIAVGHPYPNVGASNGLYMVVSGYDTGSTITTIVSSDGVSVSKVAQEQIRVYCTKSAFVTVIYG